MRITIDGITHAWNGSHTVNVYDASGVNVDVWTLFPSDGRKPSQLDILSALLTRDNDMWTTCDYCGGFADSARFCDDCITAHANRACESRPGTCAVCDGEGR